MVPSLETQRPSAEQVDIVSFVSNVLMTGRRTKTLSGAISIIEEQMPRPPDLDATSQVGRHGPDPWSLALQWAVYRCTNNHLRQNQIDELLGFIAESGNLAVLKRICRMPGPTTKTLLSKLLPSAIRLRDFVLAGFLLDQGADPEANSSDFFYFSILQTAARHHNDDVVQFLIEHGANPNHTSKHGDTPLQYALVNPGGLSTAKLLVQAGANVNPPSDIYHMSPLMRAVANQDMEAVDFFIDAGADVNFLSSLYGSSLLVAVQRGNLEMVDVLLKAGANPNRGANLYMARHLSFLPLAAAACLNMRGNITTSSKTSQNPCQIQIIDLLLQAGANVNATSLCAPGDRAGTAMQAAAASGSFDICSLFISHGGNIHAPAMGNDGMTCLQAAASSGNIDIVYLLLAMGADVNEAASKLGYTALQEAASSGNIELVNLFLDLGADVNQRTSVTALEVAIYAGHNDTVERLLDAGADVNQLGSLGSALFSAARKQNAQVFDFLVARGAYPDPPGCHVSPLIAAVEQEWAYGARLLIQAGADVNRPCTKPDSCNLPQDPDGDWDWDLKVPLVAAVMTGKIKFVEMILNAGAKLNAHTSRCLEFAVRDRSNDIVRLLLQNGANPNQVSPDNEATTPIHTAVMCENYDIDTEVLKTLIEFGANVNASSGQGYPLEIISNTMLDLSEDGLEDGHHEHARDILLQAGADPSLFKNNRSELQLAAKNGDLAEVESLILKGEDVNEPAKRNGGATALQYAAMHGHFNIAKLLTENGALINAPEAEIDGRTALEAAAENGRLDILHLLLEHDDETDLLEERCRYAATFAEKEGHKIIAQILRERKS